MAVSISRTDLARNTREIVDQVRHGQTVVVQSYGEEQIVLLDALDYRLLKAVAACAIMKDQDASGDALHETVRLYLAEQISLAKAAERLGLTRFDLMERFERLAVPLRLGPATMAEAKDEVASARRSPDPTHPVG
ncbi:MAG: type II toxin-antitoxin system prevent-host-death family antitoxin [Chloroflexi bacterium]|nr:type II toxin-antitoxin system prevent-host-death family antitoxin [Chloroflexota bacterium]